MVGIIPLYPFVRLRNAPQFCVGLLICVIMLGLIPLLADPANGAHPPPLLLSFDVEDPADIAALEKLEINEPATYFITGQFAQQYPEFVRQLAGKGTIGSHSHTHAHLTQLNTQAIRKDLAASQQAIAAATGITPVWFRAPYLEYDDKVLKVARDLGFRFDSSESERWLQQAILAELPISRNTTDKVLFSDYNIFESYGMDEALSLDLLKENYLHRQVTGRPFVFLLHPRIIARQAATLRAFIHFVKTQGGVCLSFDQYIQTIAVQQPTIKAVRIHLPPEESRSTADTVVQELVQAGTTDVFLLAQDDTGRKHYQKAVGSDADAPSSFGGLFHPLKRAGIRVHAWISVNRNAQLALNFPRQAMVSKSRQPSGQWISPSHNANRRHLQTTIGELLANWDLDGIHLDYLGYPGLEFDFADGAIEAFQRDSGIAIAEESAPNQLLTNYYDEWINWRFQEIAALAQTASATLRRYGEQPEVVLSAVVDLRSLTHFLAMETSGQDLRPLAEHLDLIIPLLDATAPLIPIPDLTPAPAVIAARAAIGNRGLLIGVPLTRSTGKSARQGKETLEQAIHASAHGTQGILLDLPHLFTSSSQEDAAGSWAGLAGLWERADEIWRQTATQTSIVAQAHANPLPTAAGPLPERPSAPWRAQLAWGMGILVLATLLTFIGKRYLSRKPIPEKVRVSPPESPPPPREWHQLEADIARGSLNGQLAREVALHLRKYDPVNVSKYRVGLVLDIIATSTEKLDMTALTGMEIDIPGWQVLGMSYLEEAVLLGCVTLKQGYAELSAKGRTELQQIEADGFTREYWMFVERRLHESLVVTCPHCLTQNVTHWFWPTFNCAKCSAAVSLESCTDLSCRTANIALNQHRLA